MTLTEAQRGRQTVLRQDMTKEQGEILKRSLSAVSSLVVQTDLALNQAIYLFTEIQSPDSGFDADDIQAVTTGLEQVMADLTPALTKMGEMQTFADENGAPVPANISAVATKYGIDPATFPDHFKVI